MDILLKKLKYKNQERIAVINAPYSFTDNLRSHLPEVQVDTDINAKYLYDFIVAFNENAENVKDIGPTCLHNLSSDGKLWMAFPRNISDENGSAISRNNGWQIIEDSGFKRVSQIIIDETWSALRFRNIKYVKSGK